MSKYNLTDLYEGMSAEEWAAAKEEDRLEKHPERDKIKAIQQMLAKEKSMKEEDVTEDNVEEITRGEFDRMDGLVSQPLLIKFLDSFEEIYSDYVEGGDEFEVQDVIEYLSTMMQNRAEDARLGFQMEGTPGPKNPDGTPKSNAEMTDDEREEYYQDLDSMDEGKEEDDKLKEHFSRFLKDYQ